MQIPSQLTPGVLPPTKVAIETIPSSPVQNVTQIIKEQNSTARDLRRCKDVSITLTCSLCDTFLFSVYYFVKYLSYYWLETWQYEIFFTSIYHAPVPWHFVLVGGSVSDTCLSHSFLNSFSLLIHTSQSLKLSIPRCCHCNEPFCTLWSISIFFILFSIHFPWYRKGEFVQQQRFLACWSFLLFSCVNELFSSVTVRRN